MVDIIRDNKGSRIADIFEEGGKLWIRNIQSARLGYYDPKLNETRDKHQRRIGSGNQLMNLL